MTSQIISDVIGNIGHITLNRPKALNALTLEMCEEITTLMTAWEDNPDIAAVLIDGAGDRAFCAGGDVILLHDSGKASDKRAETFWRTEYALNELIQRYSKPFITLIDGIVMGGGVGLSVHGDYRIAGDNTVFAMPETGIGYFPDVGGTYFLPRLGMATGQWLGLTGARLKTAQCCSLGVATNYVPSDKHEELKQALGRAKLDGSRDMVEKIVKRFSRKAPKAEEINPSIGAFFAESAQEVLENLDRDGSEWAQKQAENLRKKSPLALAVTFEALKRGGQMTFRDAMAHELDISLNFLKTQDFYEGIRAQLIDKDRNPKWSHEALEKVTKAQQERLFKNVSKPALQFLGNS
jgi:enoyl-CoA hydratase